MNLEMHWPTSSPTTLADMLEARREDITHHWVERLSESLTPDARTRCVLEDHVDGYLHELTRVLHRSGHPKASGRPERGLETRAHEQHHCPGVDLPTLVREYAVLHECILDSVAETGTRLSLSDVRTLLSFLVHDIAERVDALATDLSEHQEAEARLLRESEEQSERMAALFQQAPSAIALMQGPEHVITLTNNLHTQLFGGRQVLGKPAREAVPEVEGQGYFELLDRVYSTGEPYVGNEVPLWWDRRGNGTLEEGFFNTTYQPITGRDGRVTGIFAQGVEVTELVRARQRAEEERALVDTLLTNAPVGLCFVDKDMRYVRINRLLADITGVSMEQALGHTLYEIAPALDACLPILHQWVLDTGQPLLDYEVTGRPAGQGGRLHHYLVSHYPVRNPAGEVFLVGTSVLDITDRKRAENETEERFRLLVEGVEDYAILMLDPEGRVASWNPGAERIKGWKEEEVLGRSISLFYLPGDVMAGVPEQSLRIAATEGQYRTEALLLRKDGHQYWADILLTALRDERGNLRGFAKITRDISSRRRAEEDLRATTQRLQAILETAADGILTLDERGRIQSTNPATERIFGHPPEVLLGRDIHHLVPGFHPRAKQKPGMTGTRREVRGRREDGSLFPLELSTSEMHLPQGRFFTCITRDITARKCAEKAQALFIELGTLLSQSLDVPTTLRSIASLVVTHLADDCLVYLVGEDGQLHRHEVATSDPERLKLLQELRRHPPTMGEAAPLFNHVMERGVPLVLPEITPEWMDANALNPEHRELLGRLAPRSLILAPLLARGRKLGVINFMWTRPRPTCTTTDLELARGVADRAAMALDNARLYQEAQESIRVREDVVAIVSHDLRTPLNAIALSATTLLKRQDVDERTTKAAGRIHAAAERASRMIRDLLDLHQARTRGLPVHVEPLDFHEHILRVVKEVRLAWPERQVAFHSSGEGRGEWDGDRLAQVVTNLVGNALQHGPEGRPVRVSTRSEDSSVLLEVHNEGRPIPAEVLPGLFEPYRRGPEAGARQGSLGLGLFITRRIVLGHGGTLEVRSTEAEGTTFTVRLPRFRPR
ncbi:PAS domain S-box protein [Archangium violaceum]|uniref:sensor histidine kinase n=1 Tax=Archangium violaceum TaxID=83451 RepID=UPI00194F358D|nr:PAS domain S-box protein [Archangium violaceum]QRN98231.1 PAS domain S-box protein [Archangium violaceum]